MTKIVVDILVGIIQYTIATVNFSIWLKRHTIADLLAGVSWLMTGTIWLLRSFNAFPD